MDYLPQILSTGFSAMNTHCVRPRFASVLLWPLVFFLCGTVSHAADFQGSTHRLEFDAAPVLYSSAEATDPVGKISAKLRANRTTGWMPFHPDFGYLPAVLEMLNVPVSSQMLVFSKTSLQRHNISPTNPRALYFSDEIYIGFIPGAPEMEVASVDPDLGTVFYTVHQDKDEPVRFRRNNDCIQCHGAARSMGVPGFVLRSLETDVSGEILTATDTDEISHCTSIAQRWGGWYVTNAPSDWVHRGNSPGPTSEGIGSNRLHEIATSKLFPAAGSDTLALLLHDHQTHMHNYITRLHMEGQQRIAEYGHVRYLDNQIRAFLRYLLFTEEAPLPSPLTPSAEFVAAFQKNAKRDAKGRSLKDLDLNTRLFRYPCSFLLDSAAFRKLPTLVRNAVLVRLHAILTGTEEHPDFKRLIPDDAQAVLEILRETTPDLTVGW